MNGRIHPLDTAFLGAMDAKPPTARWEMAWILTVHGQAPTATALRARAEELAAKLPPLALRLHGRTGARFWAPSPFDASAHVSVTATDNADHQQVLARKWMDEPLPGGRPDRPGPAWQLRIAHTCGASRFTAVYTAHHAFQDGSAAARSALALLGCTPLPSPPRPRPPAFRHVADVARLAACTTIDLARSRAHRPAQFPFLTGQPGASLTDDVPLARLKAIGATTGARPNDVYVAAVGAALAHWATTCRIDLPELPVLIPLDARHPTEETWQGLQTGNRLYSTRLMLSCQETTPARRLAQVTKTLHQRTVTARHAVQDTVRHLPAPLARTAVKLATAPGYSAAVVSCCPLPAHTPPEGLRITSCTAHGPVVPGHLLAVAMCPYSQRASICFHTDAGLPRPEALLDGWRQALTELESIRVPSSMTIPRDAHPEPDGPA
ncbi:WS/DGAT domain-containing protein [Streptomyces sp. NPDC050546]|uniref:WS/DGAT domain-containing protein n=1 Tax=Streptomyces sp. NPDC050546 TaxID=3365628 RepID=UPI00379BBEEA